MPRYFFNVHNGVRARDDTGITFDDDPAARAHAQHLANRILAQGTKAMLAATVIVTDDAGKQLVRLPVQPTDVTEGLLRPTSCQSSAMFRRPAWSATTPSLGN
jgi:uncharacterized protein DUF6894